VTDEVSACGFHGGLDGRLGSVYHPGGYRFTKQSQFGAVDIAASFLRNEANRVRCGGLSEIVGGRASSEDVPIGILRNEAKSWMQAPDKKPSFPVSVAGALDGRNQVGFGLAFRLWKLRVKNRERNL
jgi:hypothetical protein